jgi:hypothetical protein
MKRIMPLGDVGVLPAGARGGGTVSGAGEECIEASLERVSDLRPTVLRRDIKLISNGFVTGSIGTPVGLIKDLLELC